ncbi:terminase large subunit [Paracoccaceae bacterium]|nr:terminase large subunit [Paracoccaceae bacterium]
MNRGEKNCVFIEAFCPIPEGAKVGKPIKLMDFQTKFILDVFDNPDGTSRAYPSVARKNGKTALIAAIVLAHLVGPETKQNSQIISGARSRDQASLVFKLAEKMIRLSPALSKIIRIIPSQKTLIGLICNVECRAISAEGGTAHGLSPRFAILGEIGQVRGPTMRLSKQLKPLKTHMMTRFLSLLVRKLPWMVICSVYGSMMQPLRMIRGLFRISTRPQKIARY